MRKVVNIIITIVLICVVLIVYFKIDVISQAVSNIFSDKKEIHIPQANEYKKNYNFINLNNEEVFYPYNKDDLSDIFFTIFNSGWEEFSFYCPKEYKSCIEDTKSIIDDESYMNMLNNYVSPFNGFKSINVRVSSSGEIITNVDKNYTIDEINSVNKKVDEILEETIIDSYSTSDKIRILHNYIIKNSVYDRDRADKKESIYKSNKAVGALLEGHAVCSGYSDALAIFLDRLHIENLKVATSNHVWNLIKVDGLWKHVDLTWDDATSGYGINNFLLIDTKKLLSLDDKEHNFDKSFYVEAN
ncbi:MAG: hypothetical protein RSB41_01295 [Bacilli bacterium]